MYNILVCIDGQPLVTGGAPSHPFQLKIAFSCAVGIILSTHMVQYVHIQVYMSALLVLYVL